MAAFFGFKRLTKIADWAGLAGEKNWKPGRSAYELAHAWQPSDGLPADLSQIIEKSEHCILHRLRIDYCYVEKPVFLDTNRGPSMTDVMVYGVNTEENRIIMAVEGKADEEFDLRVSEWIRRSRNGRELVKKPVPTKMKRLEFLSRHLSKRIPDDSKLRYQLLHRTVSAVLESQLHGAVAAIVLIHSFGKNTENNFLDYQLFLTELGHCNVLAGKVMGPCMLGEKKDLPVFFLWWHQPVDSELHPPNMPVTVKTK